MIWRSDYSLLPSSSVHSLQGAYSLDGVMALSLHGLSFPSDGESFLAIFSIGARAMVQCDSRVSMTSTATTWCFLLAGQILSSICSKFYSFVKFLFNFSCKITPSLSNEFHVDMI